MAGWHGPGVGNRVKSGLRLDKMNQILARFVVRLGTAGVIIMYFCRFLLGLSVPSFLNEEFVLSGSANGSNLCLTWKIGICMSRYYM